MNGEEYFSQTLRQLAESGRLRSIPQGTPAGVVDLASNDYLGLAESPQLADDFLAGTDINAAMLTSSASRLLAPRQDAYARLEAVIDSLYGRSSLLFNSGYHANVGIVSALADRHTLVIADRLVHASVIDGLRMSGARFERFAHNDCQHLERLISRAGGSADRILVIVESVYSMDGDCADLQALADIKRRYPRVMLYVDEAHAVGVCGPGGLGAVQSLPDPAVADIVVGTLGKALASAGAYVVCSPVMREYLVNFSRSLIFSTALPPLQVLWSSYILERVTQMDDRREHLRQLARRLSGYTGAAPSHIQPLITGSAASAVALSQHLLTLGYKVLPIRTPTVPPGTERLRFSLSAAIDTDRLDRLVAAKDQSQNIVYAGF